MSQELVVLLGGKPMGIVLRARGGRLRFRYDEAWRATAGAIPLSLSMPLVVREHEHARIEAFLWNLLPDNAAILERWARRFQVSARNAFALIAHVGEDCAGAVQLVLPERVDALTGDATPAIDWLDEAAVAERLRALRRDHAAWRSPGDAGQFSLAGAQPKTALFRSAGRWGVPSGRAPTTHILKPPMSGVDGHAENEHLCLSLAREAGLPASRTEVCWFEDQVVIVVERYDRVALQDGSMARVHQEDMCQALGRPPSEKYQNEGGPGPGDIVRVLREHSRRPQEDVDTFLGALAFNWVVGGTDAHAKNYAVLHAGRGDVRLAPLYDIASALPYDELQLRKLKLAMKIGGRHRLAEVGPRQWEDLAGALGLGSREVLLRVTGLASAIDERIGDVCDGARSSGLRDPVIDRWEQEARERARNCARRIERYLRR